MACEEIWFQNGFMVWSVCLLRVGDKISLDWELPLGPGHPDWQEHTAKVYNQQSTLLEGLPQAQRLTRSIILHDLPQRLQQAIGTNEIVDQDLLVQRCTLNSCFCYRIM